MKTFNYVITDPQGIHARPAGILVKEAMKFKSSITISSAGKKADLKRLLMVMSLAIKAGQEVAVEVEGEDEEQAVAAMETFFKENL